jgi:hypothetical protein
VTRKAPLLVSATVLGLFGCGAFGPRGGPYPGACAELRFSDRQCAAIVTRGLEELGVPRAQATEVDLLPPPPQQGISLGGGPIAVVRVHRGGGDTLERVITCVGVSGAFDPSCGGEQARMMILSGVEQSLPCTGIDPERTPLPPGVPSDPIPVGCPSAPPTPPPALAASAQALRIERKVITIDHAGHYDIPLGKATLPNGYPSEISLNVADDQPTAYWIKVLGLNVTSEIPGRPPVEYLYRALEPYDGLEPVTVSIQFDVSQYVEPGTLVLQNVVVR